jgi:hypothetical protein
MATDPEKQQAAQIRRVLQESGKPFDAAAESPLAPDVPPDRTRQFTHVNFSRARTKWAPEDLMVMTQIRREMDEAIGEAFMDAFGVLDRLWAVVREQQVSPEGEKLTMPDGSPRWVLNKLGNPVENWGALGDQERQRFIYEITTHLVGWSQRADAFWLDAMMAKGIWEEMFARGYTAQAERRLTIDDRTQAGHLRSMEDRYFAIFQAAVSRRAQSLVRTMEQLARRLEETRH